MPTGATEPVVIGPADLPVTDGSSLIVYAVGSLDADNLTVLTEQIDGLGSTPTEIPTGLAPIESTGTTFFGAAAATVFAALMGLVLFAGGRVLATARR